MPHLQDFVEEYGPHKFVVLAVNLWESWSVIEGFQNANPDIIFLRDSGSVWNTYNQTGYIPTNYIIDQEQIIRFIYIGFSESLFRLRIEGNLADVTMWVEYDGNPVPRGGMLNYSVSLKNWESTPQSVYALTQVFLPNGTPVNLLGPLPLTMAANDSMHVNLHLPVPPGAPLGTYTYKGTLGTFPPVNITDISKFKFNVVAP